MEHNLGIKFVTANPLRVSQIHLLLIHFSHCHSIHMVPIFICAHLLPQLSSAQLKFDSFSSSCPLVLHKILSLYTHSSRISFAYVRISLVLFQYAFFDVLVLSVGNVCLLTVQEKYVYILMQTREVKKEKTEHFRIDDLESV